MKSLFRSMPVLAFGALLGASLTLGEGVLAGKNETETLPLEDLRTFTEIFAKIKNDYVEPIEDKALGCRMRRTPPGSRRAPCCGACTSCCRACSGSRPSRP